MGACILCGKSAGLFYSLHKNCFKKYNDSEQVIAAVLLDGLGKKTPEFLVNTITDEISKYEFAVEARQRTLNRSLEYFYKHHIEKNKSITFDIPSWIEVIDELAPDESLFVNKHFVSQQQNLLAIQTLRNQQLPESNCNPANFSIDLRKNEQLWWCFNKSSMEKLTPTKNKQQWSVVMQLFESLLPKKNKQSLERQSLGEGKLLITNQRVCFEKDEDIVFTEVKNIYSCTPVSDGVRLQSTQLTTIPHTYFCEDGRLLYSFIKYAQNNFRAS
jgi:hypothetical protein|tara:strand:- start:929 stop:1744 length:816 start_codon:yes stop_codon:yes gene_type:complete